MAAEKCPNCGAFLPAPRPGQTSIECEYCHVQVRVTRHIPSVRPPAPAPRPRPRPAIALVGVVAAIAAGLVAFRLGPGSRARAPQQLAEPSPKQVDVSKAIAEAIPRAQKLAGDALLCSVYATLVRPDGVSDFTLGSGSVYIRFRSPKGSVAPAGTPIGSEVQLPCFIYDNYSSSYHNTHVSKSSIWDCRQPTVRAPTCTAAQVWQRALAKGAPKDAVATLGYEAVSQRDFSSRRGQSMFYDTDVALPGVWSLRVSDTARTHFSVEIPDDCDDAAPPAAVPATAAFQSAIEKKLETDRTTFWGCISITRDRVRVRSRLRIGPGGDVAETETTILSAHPRPKDPAALLSCVNQRFRGQRFAAPGAWTEATIETDLYR